MSEVSQERIEEGLAALRGDRDVGGSIRFHLSNRNFHSQANDGTFDDLFDSPEFFRRALSEELNIPFGRFDSKLPLAIADDAELVKLGIPLKYASERLLNDKPTVLACVAQNPYNYHSLPWDDGSLREDIDVVRAALKAAAAIDGDKPQPLNPFSRDGDPTLLQRIERELPENLRQNLPFLVEIAAEYGIGPLGHTKIPREDLTKLHALVSDHWTPKEKHLSWADQMRASRTEQTLSKP